MVACVGKGLGSGVYRLGKRAYRFPGVRGLTAHDFLGESVRGLTAHDFLGESFWAVWERGLFALRWAVFQPSGVWVLRSGVLDCVGIFHSV